MIVLDASATIEWLLQTTVGARVEARVFSHVETLHVPHLLDVEVGQVLRRFVAKGAITASRGDQALEDLLDLSMTRYPHDVLLGRAWQLRNILTVYDAAYVALAEALGAPLVTCDRKMASARGHHASIEVI
jgi:predicted nucleic acid-binding protein